MWHVNVFFLSLLIFDFLNQNKQHSFKMPEQTCILYDSFLSTMLGFRLSWYLSRKYLILEPNFRGEVEDLPILLFAEQEGAITYPALENLPISLFLGVSNNKMETSLPL